MIELTVLIKSIDYDSIINNILPALSEKLAQTDKNGPLQLLFGKFNELSDSAIKAALQVLPQEVKDELVVSFLENYKEDIIKNINQTAADNKLNIVIGDLKASIAEIDK